MINSKTSKALSSELTRLRVKATELVVLLEATHAVMPDDTAEQEASYRYLVGMAHRMADDLQEQLDSLDLRLHHPPTKET